MRFLAGSGFDEYGSETLLTWAFSTHPYVQLVPFSYNSTVKFFHLGMLDGHPGSQQILAVQVVHGIVGIPAKQITPVSL